MNRVQKTFEKLSGLPETTVLRDASLSSYTRFGIGGPADLFAEKDDPIRFIEAWRIAHAGGLHSVVTGNGTNLLVSDAGFRGVVLQPSNHGIRAEAETVH